MKAVPKLVLAATLCLAGHAHADVKTAGGAMALCKTEAQNTHSNYVSSKSKQIKQTRSGFRIKMRVRLEDKSISSNCEVAKDGTVKYGAS